jgi:hypothetical protein
LQLITQKKARVISVNRLLCPQFANVHYAENKKTGVPGTISQATVRRHPEM